MGRQARDGDGPAISVVVFAYNARDRIDTALEALAGQDLAEPYEVVVVASGDDGCAAYVADAYPWVHLVHSPRRLLPGEGRNAGVEAARGRFVAFLPDDCRPAPDWLSRRLALHRQGFDAVAGAITNGTPHHPVGLAGYFLEYSAQLPSRRVLSAQRIPHELSFSRDVFDRLGPHPEGLRTGEDTIFNERVVASGIPIAFDERITFAHENLTALRAYVDHQYAHGRGLVAAGRRRERPAVARDASFVRGTYELLVRYPAKRLAASLGRVARGRPRDVPAWLAVSPLIALGAWATALGAWREWRAGAVANPSAASVPE